MKGKKSRYGDRSIDKAREALTNEIKLLGGRDLIISSNLQLRTDGLPRSKQRQPEDKGVAVYFKYKDKPMCFACESWDSVEDNIWAIRLTIEAIRAIERAGASELLERAFRGFAALPDPNDVDWRQVLDVPQGVSFEQIRSRYRDLVKIHHPDVGGRTEDFDRIQKAFNKAAQEYGH
jgi:hypothetical protein